jgi:hypothetical protein
MVESKSMPFPACPTRSVSRCWGHCAATGDGSSFAVSSRSRLAWYPSCSRSAPCSPLRWYSPPMPVPMDPFHGRGGARRPA